MEDGRRMTKREDDDAPILFWLPEQTRIEKSAQTDDASEPRRWTRTALVEGRERNDGIAATCTMEIVLTSVAYLSKYLFEGDRKISQVDRRLLFRKTIIIVTVLASWQNPAPPFWASPGRKW